MRLNMILAALVVLAAMVSSVIADSFEIRSTVAEVVDDTVVQWNHTSFAGFFYDIDKDLGRESLTLTITENNVLAEDTGVEYRTEAQANDFDFEDWDQYMTIGFLADEYFAAYVDGGLLFYESTDTNLMNDEQLSKILMDDGESRTFTSGTPLKLAEGYELAIQAIDLDDNKVYVQLMKNSAVVNSAIVEPSKPGATLKDKTYVYKKDLGDTEKIVVIAVHFKNAFRGADTNLTAVDGIWQISDIPTSIKEDTEYDKMMIQSVDADAMTILMTNEDNEITLTKKRDVSLMENIRIKTADQYATPEDPLRFFIYKEITEPGTYEIRGTVAGIGMCTVEWDVSTFAGFFYNIDDNLGTERITMTITDGNVLAEDTGVFYTTEGQLHKFDFEDWGDYATIGFLADEYFAAYADGSHLAGESTDSNLMKDEQLSKVLMDDDSSTTFTSGIPLKLAEGYELAIQAIDLDDNKVYVQLMKNGAVVNSAIVEPSKPGATLKDKTYVYKKDLGDTEKIVVIAVHFKNAFRGADTNLTTVDGIWQISDIPTSIKEDTEYDKMMIQSVDADAMTILMTNEDNEITLTKKRDVSLMENIRIKTADQDEITAENPLRFYIYKEETIELDGQETAEEWVEKVEKGWALYNQGKYDEAIQAYDEAIRIDSEWAFLWNGKGNALFYLGKYDEAIQAYDEAIRLDPEYATAWNNKGSVLDDLGKYAEAIQAYDEAIRLDPEYATAWNGKGNALFYLGKYDESIQAYDEAIRLDPENDLAWVFKGSALGMKGKHAEAIRAYDEAIRLDPENDLAWLLKGIALYGQGKYDDAIRAYDEVIRLDPGNADVWDNKARVYRAVGMHAEADAALARAGDLRTGQR